MLAGITSSITDAVAQHGVLAIFGLMAFDALLPVGGELIMLYAGVLAAGAVAGHHPGLFGMELAFGLASYLVLALAGSLGYLAGSVVGWFIGQRGGRRLIERHGRWVHLSPERFDRAERWFDRWGGLAVLLGRVTPLVRSFISIPAGVLGSPLGPYTALTLVGSLIWCFAFAGVGWAIGGSWSSVHDGFRYVDYGIVALICAGAAVLLARRRQSRASL